MSEPKVGRPHWPDAISKPSDDLSALKPWNWAIERLEKSHNYWISTARPDGRPHLMVIWGIWWEDAFWFSTGPKTRKAKNIAAQPYCVLGTEKADEAVIVEGTAVEITDRAEWKRMGEVYDRKYGGKLLPLLESSGGLPCSGRQRVSNRAQSGVRPRRARRRLRSGGDALDVLSRVVQFVPRKSMSRRQMRVLESCKPVV